MKKKLNTNILTTLSIFITLLLGIFFTLLFPDITRIIALVTFLSLVVYQWLLPNKTTKRSKIVWHIPLKLSLFIVIMSQSIMFYERVAPSLAAKLASDAAQQTSTSETFVKESSEEIHLSESETASLSSSSYIEEFDESSDNDELMTKQTATLIQVVNANTVYLMVNGQQAKYRLLVIDSPDTTDHYTLSQQADQRLRDILTNATTIEVSYDPSTHSTDDFNRELVYLWADGELVQTTLLKEGLAEVSYIDSDDLLYLEDMKSAENYAINHEIGIWENDNEQSSPWYNQESRIESESHGKKHESDYPTDYESDNSYTMPQEGARYETFDNWLQQNKQKRNTYSTNR
ncbi:thermonuclease family protein [Vagococcus xieshaowenii]|uniref:Thermonuclease family protein n=1 Tax=Vagococcus xieshaowenii TaxID=2562451 RepID=A0AAJ5JLH8_9ENTE|nr:thermonuclease family protein [Vagococcus xieshaowenii]QCA28456.1 thermonuclease family protein [Vagococcus xieshaowenii]TFZ42789.1 thermonuclease family protein [Vagococcus xieshaowenii]